MSRHNKHHIRIKLEALEDRYVPDSGLTASLANGVLSILGTGCDDIITVRHTPAQSRMAGSIRIDGLSQSFNPALVKKVIVHGGDGNDTITMISPKTTLAIELWGDANDDILYGSASADKLFGLSGNDILRGGAGNDLLDGGEGDDQLYGDAGIDTLYGDTGSDSMYGGEGGDTLIGGTGDDYYQGNYGVDYYVEAFQDIDTYDDNPSDPLNRVFQMAGSSHPLAWYDSLRNDQFRSVLRNLTSDGQFLRQDALALLAQAGISGVVIEDEFIDLQRLAESNELHMPEPVFQLFRNVVTSNPANELFQGNALGQLQVDSSAEHLNTLVRKWFLGQDHPTTLSTEHTYRYAQGTLFGSTNTVNAKDVRAGYPNISNTNFFAGMMTVAQSSPASIKNLFISNGDGTYTVKLFEGQNARYVTVDRYLPADAEGKLVYGQLGAHVNNTRNVLWPALLEKAIAQAAEASWLPQRTSNTHNAYSSLNGTSGNSLRAGEVVTLLTGRNSSIGNRLTSETYADLLKAYQSKEMVVVAANFPPNYGTITNPIVAVGRYYTIIGYTPAYGGMFKLLAAHGSGYGKDSTGMTVPGIITLSKAQFLANMQYYDTTVTNRF